MQCLHILSAIAGALVAFACGCAGAAAAPVTVITLGDSYINGYKLQLEETFPVLLQAALNAAGYDVVVRETGFKETSKSGVSWLRSKAATDILANPARTVLLLELGGNDCSRIALEQTQANLDTILAALADVHIPVLLIGTEAYDYCGPDYIPLFRQMFVDLAAQYKLPLYPDFKTGITGHPDLLGADGDHANAAGEAVVVSNMLPAVEHLIAQLPK